MKNKVLILTVLAMLSLPVSVQAVDDFVEINQIPQNEEVQPAETTDVQEVELPPVLEEQEQEFKQPVSKRKLAKKFIIAMLSVAGSSIAIFFGLTIYNKLREGFCNGVKTKDDEVSLQTPNNTDSAIKTFLEKTKWE